MAKKNMADLLLKGDIDTVNNSLEGFTQAFGTMGLGGWGLPVNYNTPQNSRIDTIFLNTRWYLISNFRQILSEAYVEYGIVQTLVDQPVADAFRTGFDIKTAELDLPEIQKLQVYLERNRIINKIQQACNWARLFGGSGLIVMTDQDPAKPLDIEAITEDSELDFRPADLWELFRDEASVWNPWSQDYSEKAYSFYGIDLHPSRVMPMRGKEAPAFLAPRLRGWGMSELERVVRSINSYLKNQDLIFELLDEAKVDVFQLQNFNVAMLSEGGTERTRTRVQLANRLKNYLNALVLDANDHYEQKTLTFNGLSEILNQIRQGIAADLKMPMTKLFGISSAGFNSGEDDIENYNSMVESEVRSKVKFIVIEVLEIICQKLFGFIPSDLMIEFKPLRVLSAEQEENMKDKQYNRLASALANQIVTPAQFMEGCNNAGLLPITFSNEDIASSNNLYKIGVEEPVEEKKGFLSRVFKKNEPEKAKTPENPSEEGKVKITDVTSNKFTVPDRERKPLGDEPYPYKSKRTKRYIEAGG